MGALVVDIINDDAGGRYIVSTSGLYKMGEKKPMAAFSGFQRGFAMQDTNRFIGIDGYSMLYFENGKVDTLKDIAGKGYLIYNCLRVPGGYLLVDERRWAYFFDPIAKTVRRLATPPDFQSYSRNGHVLESTPFGNGTLISAGGSIFWLANGDSSIVQEVLRNYQDSSLIDTVPGESIIINSISRAKPNRDIFLSGDAYVYRLRGRIPSAPVAIGKRQSPAGNAAGLISAGKRDRQVLINGRRYRSTQGHAALYREVEGPSAK
jgi:hypothetical protein